MAPQFRFNLIGHIQWDNIAQAERQVQGLGKNLNIGGAGGQTLRNLQAAAGAASATTDKLNASFQQAAKGSQVLARGLQQGLPHLNLTIQATSNLSLGLEKFAEQSGLALRRFLAFTGSAGAVIRLTSEVKAAVKEAIDFADQMTKIQQVSGPFASQVGAISAEVTGLATSLGVSSKELANAALVLKQAGLPLEDVRKSLRALAESALAPNFDSISQTAETAIATFRQFNVSAEGLKDVLGSINAVAGDFAVEAGDLSLAIQRAGSTAVQSGASLKEFISLFTAVRSTTRESAETISTGLRTIFTRLQRPETVDALKALRVDLRYTAQEAQALGRADLENQFVGAYEAVRRLSAGLKGLRPTDPRFGFVVEELGGYRQISKVLPLLQQFQVAEQALAASQAGSVSLTAAQEKRQESLANQLGKVKEEFLGLFRTIEGSNAFQSLARDLSSLVTLFIKALHYAGPLVSVLGGYAAGRGLSSVISSVANRVTGAPPSGLDRAFGAFTSQALYQPRRFHQGGYVPGTGEVPAQLQGGEFVMRREAVRQMDRYAPGGLLRANEGRFIAGKRLRDQSLDITTVPAGRVEEHFSPKHIEAIKNYTSGSRAINLYLRARDEYERREVLREHGSKFEPSYDKKADDDAFLASLDPNNDDDLDLVLPEDLPKPDLLGRKTNIDKTIRSLRGAFRRSKLLENTTLYRRLPSEVIDAIAQGGVNLRNRRHQGKLFAPQGFSSTSTNPSLSTFGEHLLALQVRGGTPAIDAEYPTLSGVSYEKELILPENLKFEILRAQKNFTLLRQLKNQGGFVGANSGKLIYPLRYGGSYTTTSKSQDSRLGYRPQFYQYLVDQAPQLPPELQFNYTDDVSGYAAASEALAYTDELSPKGSPHPQITRFSKAIQLAKLGEKITVWSSIIPEPEGQIDNYEEGQTITFGNFSEFSTNEKYVRSQATNAYHTAVETNAFYNSKGLMTQEPTLPYLLRVNVPAGKNVLVHGAYDKERHLPWAPKEERAEPLIFDKNAQLRIRRISDTGKGYLLAHADMLNKGGFVGANQGKLIRLPDGQHLTLEELYKQIEEKGYGPNKLSHTKSLADFSRNALPYAPKGSFYLGSGAVGLALKTPQGDVLRSQSEAGVDLYKKLHRLLSGHDINPAVLSTNRLAIPEILQATDAKQLGKTFLERLPFAEDIPQNERARVLKDLNRRLALRGLRVVDDKIENLGRLGGRNLVRDPGAIGPLGPEDLQLTSFVEQFASARELLDQKTLKRAGGGNVIYPIQAGKDYQYTFSQHPAKGPKNLAYQHLINQAPELSERISNLLSKRHHIEDINNFDGQPDIPDLPGAIQALDEGLSQSKLGGPLTVYQAWGPGEHLPLPEAGQTFVDSGFFRGSINRDKTIRNSRSIRTREPGATLLRVSVPEGKNVLVEGAYGDSKREELLFDRGSSLKIQRVTDTGKGYLLAHATMLAGGGLVPGKGDTDSVPAHLPEGSFVVRKGAVQKAGVSRLQKLARGFASGGLVPTILTPEEYVFAPDEVARIGTGALHRLNTTGDLSHIRGFNKGGFVGLAEGDVVKPKGSKAFSLASLPETEPEFSGIYNEIKKLGIEIKDVAGVFLKFKKDGSPVFGAVITSAQQLKKELDRQNSDKNLRSVKGSVGETKLTTEKDDRIKALFDKPHIVKAIEEIQKAEDNPFGTIGKRSGQKYFTRTLLKAAANFEYNPEERKEGETIEQSEASQFKAYLIKSALNATSSQFLKTKRYEKTYEDIVRAEKSEPANTPRILDEEDAADIIRKNNAKIISKGLVEKGRKVAEARISEETASAAKPVETAQPILPPRPPGKGYVGHISAVPQSQLFQNFPLVQTGALARVPLRRSVPSDPDIIDAEFRVINRIAGPTPLQRAEETARLGPLQRNTTLINRRRTPFGVTEPKPYGPGQGIVSRHSLEDQVNQLIQEFEKLVGVEGLGKNIHLQKRPNFSAEKVQDLISRGYSSPNEALGDYEFGKDRITLFTDNIDKSGGNYRRVIGHELGHRLSVIKGLHKKIVAVGQATNTISDPAYQGSREAYAMALEKLFTGELSSEQKTQVREALKQERKPKDIQIPMAEPQKLGPASTGISLPTKNQSPKQEPLKLTYLPGPTGRDPYATETLTRQEILFREAERAARLGPIKRALPPVIDETTPSRKRAVAIHARLATLSKENPQNITRRRQIFDEQRSLYDELREISNPKNKPSDDFRITDLSPHNRVYGPTRAEFEQNIPAAAESKNLSPTDILKGRRDKLIKDFRESSKKNGINAAPTKKLYDLISELEERIRDPNYAQNRRIAANVARLTPEERRKLTIAEYQFTNAQSPEEANRYRAIIDRYQLGEEAAQQAGATPGAAFPPAPPKTPRGPTTSPGGEDPREQDILRKIRETQDALEAATGRTTPNRLRGRLGALQKELKDLRSGRLHEPNLPDQGPPPGFPFGGASQKKKTSGIRPGYEVIQTQDPTNPIYQIGDTSRVPRNETYIIGANDLVQGPSPRIKNSYVITANDLVNQRRPRNPNVRNSYVVGPDDLYHPYGPTGDDYRRDLRRRGLTGRELAETGFLNIQGNTPEEAFSELHRQVIANGIGSFGGVIGQRANERVNQLGGPRVISARQQAQILAEEENRLTQQLIYARYDQLRSTRNISKRMAMEIAQEDVLRGRQAQERVVRQGNRVYGFQGGYEEAYREGYEPPGGGGGPPGGGRIGRTVETANRLLERLGNFVQTPRGFAAIGALGLASGYGAQALSSYAGDPSKAIASGTEGRFTGFSAGAGLLSGATVGASFGFGVGSIVPGVGQGLGVAIGAIAGGAIGAATAFREAERQIRDTKVAEAMQIFAERISLLNSTLNTELATTEDLGMRLRLSGEALQQLNRRQTASTARDVTDSTVFNWRGIGQFLGDAVSPAQYLPGATLVTPALEAAGSGISNFFSAFRRFDFDQYSGLRQRSLRQEIGPQLGSLIQGVTGEIEGLVRRGAGASENPEVILQRLLASGGGLTRANITSIQELRGISRDTIEEELNTQIRRTQASVRTERTVAQGRDFALSEATAFERFIRNLQAASDSLHGLRQQSQILAQTFDNNQQAISVTGHGERLNQIGRGDQGSLEPLRLLSNFRFGDEFLNRGRLVEQIGNILDSVLLEAARSNPSEGRDFSGQVNQGLLRGLGYTAENAPADVVRAISQITGTISDLTREGGVLALQRRIGADVSAVRGQVLEPQTGPLRQQGQAGIQILEQAGNAYVQGLAQRRQQQFSLLEGREAQGRLGVASYRQARQFELENTFRRGDFPGSLDLTRLQAPFLQTQRELVGIPGAEQDPRRIGEQLRAVNDRLRGAGERQQAAFISQGPFSDAFRRAAEETNRLQQQSNNLTTALRRLADASERNTVLQERAAAVENDRQSRLGLAERYATADVSGRLQIQRGLLLANEANRQGTLDNFAPEQQGEIVNVLRSAGQSRLLGFQGSPVAADLLERLLSNSFRANLPGLPNQPAFGLAPQQQRERAALQGEINVNNAGAEAAQRELNTTRQSLLDPLERLLTTQNERFFARLEALLTSEQAGRVRVRIGQAEDRQRELQRTQGNLDVLREAGITTPALLSQARYRQQGLQEAATNLQLLRSSGTAYYRVRGDLPEQANFIEAGSRLGEANQREALLGRLRTFLLGTGLTPGGPDSQIERVLSRVETTLPNRGEITPDRLRQNETQLRATLIEAVRQETTGGIGVTRAREQTSQFFAANPDLSALNNIRGPLSEPSRAARFFESLANVSPDNFSRVNDQLATADQNLRSLNETLRLLNGAAATPERLSASGTMRLLFQAAGFASGGVVGRDRRSPGPGDIHPALLSAGEGILNPRAMNQPGVRGLVDRLNSGVQHFAQGGPVRRFSGARPVVPDPEEEAFREAFGGAWLEEPPRLFSGARAVPPDPLAPGRAQVEEDIAPPLASPPRLFSGARGVAPSGPDPRGPRLFSGARGPAPIPAPQPRDVVEQPNFMQRILNRIRDDEDQAERERVMRLGGGGGFFGLGALVNAGAEVAGQVNNLQVAGEAGVGFLRQLGGNARGLVETAMGGVNLAPFLPNIQALVPAGPIPPAQPAGFHGPAPQGPGLLGAGAVAPAAVRERQAQQQQAQEDFQLNFELRRQALLNPGGASGQFLARSAVQNRLSAQRESLGRAYIAASDRLREADAGPRDTQEFNRIRRLLSQTEARLQTEPAATALNVQSFGQLQGLRTRQRFAGQVDPGAAFGRGRADFGVSQRLAVQSEQTRGTFNANIRGDAITERLRALRVQGQLAQLGPVGGVFGRGFAAGGRVDGPGGIDRVPAWLTAGEHVTNARSAAANRELLEQINNARGPVHLKDGGFVKARPDQSRPVQVQDAKSAPQEPPQINFGELEKSISGLQSAFTAFAGPANSLADAIRSMPKTIGMDAKHDVRVTINGADILKGIEPGVRAIVEEKIRDAMKAIARKMPEAGLETD